MTPRRYLRQHSHDQGNAIELIYWNRRDYLRSHYIAFERFKPRDVQPLSYDGYAQQFYHADGHADCNHHVHDDNRVV